MAVNISVYLPRQYLRAASSVADAVDSARLRFGALGAVAVAAMLVDCLRLSVPNCGDEDILLAMRELTPVDADFFLLSSSSEPEDDSAAMRRLIGCCR